VRSPVVAVAVAAVLAMTVAGAVEEVTMAARDRICVKSGKMQMALMGQRRSAATGVASQAISPVN
jgi:hypothetical protein